MTRDTAREPVFLPFAGEGLRTARRVMAILFGIGSILGGLAVTGAMFFLSVVLEFGSTPDGTDIAVAAALGALVAIGGLAVAVAAYRSAGARTGVTVGPDELEIAYRSFSRPMTVPRSAVRVVAVEDGRAGRRERERFPVAGHLPDDVFVDALDNPAAGPLDDLETTRRGRIDPWPGVIWERPETPSHGPAYTHDDPSEAGWGSGGSPVPPIQPRPESAYLFNRNGSSLPFLRADMMDVPNVAVIFNEPIRMPRSAWWFALVPLSSRALLFPRGRTTRGLLMRVQDPDAAARALTPWGLVREITADDVTEEGLLLAKPLIGWRAAVYVLLVGGPVLLNLIIRWIR